MFVISAERKTEEIFMNKEGEGKTYDGKREGRRCEEGGNLSLGVGIQKLLPTFDLSGEKRMYWHGRALLVYI